MQTRPARSSTDQDSKSKIAPGAERRSIPGQQQTANQPAGVAAAAGMSPDHDTIARKAYELWMERGQPDGSPERDWFEAEEQLRRISAPAVRARTQSGAA